MTQIAVIIPAYNEEESIAAVVSQIHQTNREIQAKLCPVVINDGSKDRTGEIIDSIDCVALQLPVNLGIGGAVQTGFKYAYEHGFDYAVQVDGDGQHPPDQLPILLEELESKGLDVVIGSRFLLKQGFQSSWIRRVGIRYFQIVNRLLTGLKITDSTSGLRMLNRKAMAIVSDYYPDEYPEPEAIILFNKHKLKIGEVSVQMKERQGGTSSIGTFSAVYYMFKVSLAMLFTYMRLLKV